MKKKYSLPMIEVVFVGVTHAIMGSVDIRKSTPLDPDDFQDD